MRILAIALLGALLTACSSSIAPEQGFDATSDAPSASIEVPGSASGEPTSAAPASSESDQDPENAQVASSENSNDPPVDVPTESEDQAPEEGRIVTPEALASCALVEAGYIAGLDGDSSAAQLLSDGAAAAVRSHSVPYPELGESIAESKNQSDAAQAAEAFLIQCESDGFERLAG